MTKKLDGNQTLKFPCASCNNGNLIYSSVIGGMICTNEFCRMNKSTWRINHKEPNTSRGTCP